MHDRTTTDPHARWVDVYEQGGHAYLVVRDRNGVAEMLCIASGNEARVRSAVSRGDVSVLDSLREQCRHHGGGRPATRTGPLCCTPPPGLRSPS
ncbi:hypothetical protein CLV35_1964 [Motilibacter peucedani]|uniref:Uncharacterized protein n=1 Tax=Motilibacter peucedani TaxID=598650 RepID=A0A420XQI8_9ACTN|nr:hypothetical protein [Motilibacter peucedani]RKS75494.1 hypothetical protein CLV35_1964 [Motilibacter peucedani]